MKKILHVFFFALLFVFTFAGSVSADVLPPNTRPVERCVKFVNLNAYPDIVLIGYYTGPMVKGYEAYVVKNNTCLTKGYKFNTLSIYWNTKENGTKIDSNKKLLEDIEPYGGYVDMEDTLKKEDIEYSIAGSVNGGLIAYMSKEVRQYTDGKSNTKTYASPIGNTVVENKGSSKIETKPNVESTVVTVPTQPVKNGFWERVWCFFGFRKYC